MKSSIYNQIVTCLVNIGKKELAQKIVASTIEVKRMNNGQYVVKKGRFTLTQTDKGTIKFNELTKRNFDGTYTMLNPNKSEFKDMFIALYNFKHK